MENFDKLVEFEDGYYHKAKYKDTLWTISKEYNVKVDKLMQLNNLTNVSTSELEYVLVQRK